MNFKIIFGKYHQVPAEDFSYALLCVAYDYTSKSNISAKETNDLMAGRRAVVGQVDRSESAVKNVWERVDTRRYPRAENRVCSDQEDHEEIGSKDCATNTLWTPQ
ncbi:hypothetical protein TNCV_968601 [Trichonephila clavipes]|nr:hypothetical protein TNCV_968601 [Trichonephila clavipes]